MWTVFIFGLAVWALFVLWHLATLRHIPNLFENTPSPAVFLTKPQKYLLLARTGTVHALDAVPSSFLFKTQPMGV